MRRKKIYQARFEDFSDTRYAYDKEIWYMYYGLKKYRRLGHSYRNDSIHHNINFYRIHGDII